MIRSLELGLLDPNFTKLDMGISIKNLANKLISLIECNSQCYTIELV